jgi:hypothetical protein
MKQCTKCNQLKAYDSFYASKKHRSGYANVCKVCESARNKVKTQANKDRRLAVAKAWRDANKDKQDKAVKAWREDNAERYAKFFVEHREANRGAYNAKWMAREVGKKMRTPKWLTESDWLAIKCKYQVAAMLNKHGVEKWDVDHIIPLNGKTVSGLHVPWNLQVITAKQNKIKGNRI